MKQFVASGTATRTEWWDWDGSAPDVANAEEQIRAMLGDVDNVEITEIHEVTETV